MADISKVTLLNGTTYNLKDERLPAYVNEEQQYLRSDGSWSVPVVTSFTLQSEVTDDDTGMLVEPTSGNGATIIDMNDGMFVATIAAES